MDNLVNFFKNLELNGIKLLWVSDPLNNKGPSVSLSLLVLSTVLLVAAILAPAFPIFKLMNADLAFNFWMGCATLYFARKVSVGNKTASTTKEE